VGVGDGVVSVGVGVSSGVVESKDGSTADEVDCEIVGRALEAAGFVEVVQAAVSATRDSTAATRQAIPMERAVLGIDAVSHLFRIC
jgi:hypothetical protein